MPAARGMPAADLRKSLLGLLPGRCRAPPALARLGLPAAGQRAKAAIRHALQPVVLWGLFLYFGVFVRQWEGAGTSSIKLHVVKDITPTAGLTAAMFA